MGDVDAKFYDADVKIWTPASKLTLDPIEGKKNSTVHSGLKSTVLASEKALQNPLWENGFCVTLPW